MKLTVTDIANEQPIPERFAFGAIDPEHHVRLAANRNPALSWTDVPAGARSLALICVDTCVPTRPDDVNRDGRVVPASLPRANFYHWVMVDLPPALDRIDEAACSDGISARGKQSPPGPAGSRQGLNDYTGWFAGDADMEGQYLGYDGPCPPWNDALVHRYHFRLYALDIERLPVSGAFTGPQVEAAMADHVLAEAEVIGTYTLNPALA